MRQLILCSVLMLSCCVMKPGDSSRITDSYLRNVCDDLLLYMQQGDLQSLVSHLDDGFVMIDLVSNPHAPVRMNLEEYVGAFAIHYEAVIANHNEQDVIAVDIDRSGQMAQVTVEQRNTWTFPHASVSVRLVMHYTFIRTEGRTLIQRVEVTESTLI